MTLQLPFRAAYNDKRPSFLSLLTCDVMSHNVGIAVTTMRVFTISRPGSNRSSQTVALWVRHALRFWVKACPTVKKVLFRALLTQLHPGGRWNPGYSGQGRIDLRRGPEYGYRLGSGTGKGYGFIRSAHIERRRIS